MRRINRIRLFLRNLQDQKEGREEIGQDKFGNRLYQYYSFFGLPTKRECEYIHHYKVDVYNDNAFYFWLKKFDDLPPLREDVLL